MKVAIDNAGRLVLPKVLRTELGISGPTEVEVIAAEGFSSFRYPMCQRTWRCKTASR